MKISGKAIAAILVVAALALGGLLAQKSSSTSSALSYNLTKQDMEILVNEVLPPQRAVSMNSTPEGRQEFIKQLKSIFAVAQAAEVKGLADKPDIQEQIKLRTDVTLREAYMKKHPDIKISDEDVASYYAANPKAFDNFLEAIPQFKAQAQGPQGEGLKKEFAMLKVAADRARQEKLDQDSSSKIKSLLARSEVLYGAYVEDLQKNSDKLVSDEDVQKYYSEHPNEFEEVHARHILISTSPSPAPPGGKDEKDAKPKTLSKEDAKKKALGLLERIRKGENFEKLAQENSDDGSKAQGGDLGYFAKDGRMVPEFETAAFALKTGEVSDVVESQFGYHIIKIEDHRTKPLDEETKKEITDKLKETKIKEHIDELVAHNDVKIAEDFQVTVTAPATPPGLSLPVQPSSEDENGPRGADKQAAPATDKNAKPTAGKEKKK